MLVKNWMSKEVITVDVDDSMQNAIYILQEHKINILPVMENGNIVGIITDRDLKKASPSDATTLDMHELMYIISKIKIRNLMKKNLYTIPPDFTIEEAAAMLMEKRISGLPVVDEKKQLIGIITRSDIFRVIISLTGLGKKGLQFAVRIKDKPGPIKEIRELISEYGARTASILSSGDNAPPGYLHIYFRIYQMDRGKLPSLMKEIEKKGDMLYIVDHKEDKRTVYQT
jgi:acetoin utilization protein AcuB